MMSNNEESTETLSEVVYEVGDTYTDDLGEWLVTEGDGRLLLKPTEKHFESQKQPVEPPSKSPLDIIGEQLVEKDIRIMELEAQNTDLGTQIVEKDIQILLLETRQSDIGQQIVDLDIRLMEGGL